MNGAPFPDPAARFSRRVEDYVRYRPGYPAAMLAALRARGALPAGAVVADLGSGTGISSELFLRAGHPVRGVEPNAGMRGAAERSLSPVYPELFTSVNATAEATTLPDASVDLVAAGQAFHWFDPVAARAEFVRILRPGGCMALMWNERKLDATPFLVAYEELLNVHGTDYAAVRDAYPTADRIRAFAGPNGFHRDVFPNRQSFGYESLRGRLLSSSYAPEPGHPQHAPMLTALRKIFDAHQWAGRVHFEYDTVLYSARLR